MWFRHFSRALNSKCGGADPARIRRNSSGKRTGQCVLGIETSCDDTGCAVVDEEGNILGEALSSQQETHLNNGGIIPPIAQNLHRKNIVTVVNAAVANSNVSFEELDAIAATVKPGLPMSLEIGTKYAKHLCRKYHKPFIPIHHMEAHALTARMLYEVPFPFMVLLISGGHCLLAVAQDIDKFLLMGDTMDDAPGEAFDKMARRMKLRNMPEFAGLSGGEAIELAASKADDPLRYRFSTLLLHYQDCNFSMSGIKNQVHRHLVGDEENESVPPDGAISGVYNLCAGFLLVTAKHLCHRVQRGMKYAELKGLIPQDKQTLVVSGGAASNNFIVKGLRLVCDELGYELVRPPRKYCTDNGVMIAWNGMERWLSQKGVTVDYDDVAIEKSCPLGTRIIEEVAKENLGCRWVKLKELEHPSAFVFANER